MDPVNIKKYKRGDAYGSAYRLLSEPVALKVKLQHVPGPEELAWEDDGGPSVPQVVEVTVKEYHRQRIGLRGSRKQRAARAVAPKESVRVVNLTKPAPMEVVAVRLAGGSEQDEKVAALEARIKALMAVVRAPIVAEERRKESISRFEELFNAKRTKA